MNEYECKAFSTDELKRIKTLEIAQAYAEYRSRHKDTIEGDLIDFTGHILRFVEKGPDQA